MGPAEQRERKQEAFEAQAKLQNTLRGLTAEELSFLADVETAAVEKRSAEKADDARQLQAFRKAQSTASSVGVNGATSNGVRSTPRSSSSAVSKNGDGNSSTSTSSSSNITATTKSHKHSTPSNALLSLGSSSSSVADLVVPRKRKVPSSVERDVQVEEVPVKKHVPVVGTSKTPVTEKKESSPTANPLALLSAYADSDSEDM